MYNLLVTAINGDFEDGSYLWDKSRFLEYTNEDISLALKKLSTPHIENLKSYPCLFAYEGKESDVRIGFFTSIKDRDRTIHVTYEFLENIDAIPFDKLQPIVDSLDIRPWEMNRTHWAVKDEDLFEILQNHEILQANQVPKENKQARPVEDKSSDVPVKNIQGFIQKVLNLGQKDGYEVFYRGHSNQKKYKLEPSLFRKDENGNWLYRDNEHILYRELLVSNSADFQSDVYTLDSLVRMQHYSLPTRLLDITSNPLIALYFACKSSPDENGEVIVFSMERKDVEYFDSDVASYIANLARLSQSEKNAIELNKDEFEEQSPIKKLLSFIKEEKPVIEKGTISGVNLRKIVCVKAKQSNDRISSQSGAFLLYGLDSKCNENNMDGMTISRIQVANKKSMLRELDLLNIRESTVFPYIENSAKYLADKFKFDKSSQPAAGDAD